MLLLLEQLLFYIEFALFTYSKYNKTIQNYSSTQNSVSYHRLAQVQPVFPLSTFHFQTKTGMLLKKFIYLRNRVVIKIKQ